MCPAAGRGHKWPGRSMDRMPVSDTGDAGSIPARASISSAARLQGGGEQTKERIRIMATDSMINEDKPVLKFSEVMKMFRARQIEMDEPGVWMMADGSGSSATYKQDEPNTRNGLLFPMAAGAFGTLIAKATQYDSKAWGTIAEWFASPYSEKQSQVALEGTVGLLEAIAAQLTGKESEEQEGGAE